MATEWPDSFNFGRSFVMLEEHNLIPVPDKLIDGPLGLGIQDHLLYFGVLSLKNAFTDSFLSHVSSFGL